MKARFDRVRWDSPTLYFQATLGDLRKNLWISLPEGAERPDDDLIAGVFATLAGPDLDQFEVDLAVSHPIRSALEAYTKCSLSARPRDDAVDWTSEEFDRHAVSFSGGFDSLAARALSPGDPELISMDFGGWFKREADFFTKFSPCIVKTNFRMEGFGRRSWMFMLSGVLLLKEHLQVGAYTTGSILESSPWHYRRNIEGAFSAPPLLQAFGLQQVNTTVGITEVSTTLLAMLHFPNDIGGSLTSLAPPGTGKSQRKHMLMSTLYREGKAPLSFTPRLDTPEVPPLAWGESLTDDMLTAYMIKHSGSRAAEALMSGIPSSIRDIALDFHLTFFERYHTGLYQGLPERFIKHIRNTFSDAGIEPFTERDWSEYRAVSEILSEFHQVHID